MNIRYILSLKFNCLENKMQCSNSKENKTRQDIGPKKNRRGKFWTSARKSTSLVAITEMPHGVLWIENVFPIYYGAFTYHSLVYPIKRYTIEWYCESGYFTRTNQLQMNAYWTKDLTWERSNLISSWVSGVSYVAEKCLPTLSRAYGKRTSVTKDMGVVVPSMSRTIQRCKDRREKKIK